MIKHLKLDQMHIGDKAELSKIITKEDIEKFADVTMDNNPIHMDAEYAQKSRFGARIAHGILSAGLISAVLGTKLPGPGAIYMKQDLHFLKPVFIGDTVTATCTVTEKMIEKSRVVLETTVRKQDGAVVITGCATMYILQ